MIVVKNNILPFSGFKAMTMWPFIFVRTELSEVDLNHEKIHGRQQIEMLWILFYLWYGVEYLLRALFGGYKPYREISFEREAYDKDIDLNYLKHRRFWAFLKYIKED